MTSKIISSFLSLSPSIISPLLHSCPFYLFLLSSFSPSFVSSFTLKFPHPMFFCSCLSPFIFSSSSFPYPCYLSGVSFLLPLSSSSPSLKQIQFPVPCSPVLLPAVLPCFHLYTIIFATSVLCDVQKN